jgi:hypothetical protein
VGTGTLAVSGQVKDYLKNRDFQFKTKFDKLDLSQCLDQSAYSVKVRGLVSGTVEGGATGGETQSSPPALKAAGNIEVKEGRLVDMNVLKMVLDKIPVISNLTSLLEAGLPAEFREKLVQKDTAVPSLKLSASLADGTITIQPVSLEADGFSFKGEGSIGADRQYSLKGSFVIEPEMASRMAESVSEIKFLMDETLRIRFPLKVTGKGGSVSFAPDVQGIGVSAIKNTVTNELQKVFDKVFKPAEEQPKQTVP